MSTAKVSSLVIVRAKRVKHALPLLLNKLFCTIVQSRAMNPNKKCLSTWQWHYLQPEHYFLLSVDGILNAPTKFYRNRCNDFGAVHEHSNKQPNKQTNKQKDVTLSVYYNVDTFYNECHKTGHFKYKHEWRNSQQLS